MSSGKPLRVAVTGACGQIAYSLLPLLVSGKVFGPNQKVTLLLVDLNIPAVLSKLEGVAMELTDCAYPLLADIVVTGDLKVGFKDADVVVFLGAFPRKDGMERKDLLEKNAGIFKEQGGALDAAAARTVKCLVVGNPANTNCATLMASAPSLSPKNFSALTRLDQNRAYGQLAKKLNADVANIDGVFIFGNHSSTQVPTIVNATIEVNGSKKSIREAVNDDTWLDEEFVKTVQTRGAAVIKQRGNSSALSAANAVADHLRDWFLGTNGRIVSMAIPSDGSYNVPKGLVFSFPVTCAGGETTIVQGVPIDERLEKLLSITKEELISEQNTAFSMLGISAKY